MKKKLPALVSIHAGQNLIYLSNTHLSKSRGPVRYIMKGNATQDYSLLPFPSPREKNVLDRNNFS